MIFEITNDDVITKLFCFTITKPYNFHGKMRVFSVIELSYQ